MHGWMVRLRWAWVAELRSWLGTASGRHATARAASVVRTGVREGGERDADSKSRVGGRLRERSERQGSVLGHGDGVGSIARGTKAIGVRMGFGEPEWTVIRFCGVVRRA